MQRIDIDSVFAERASENASIIINLTEVFYRWQLGYQKLASLLIMQIENFAALYLQL